MYIVVGANGFLGSYVIKSLVSSTDEKIIATYHNKPESLYSPRVDWVKLDVTDKESILNLKRLVKLNLFNYYIAFRNIIYFYNIFY